MNIPHNILSRRVEKVLPTKQGLADLMQLKKIKLYQGFDPTGGRLHLGHTVGIRKLMDFANAGHEVIFLFGTGTVLVGDPSERDTGRKLITQEEIDANILDWKKQVSPLVDFEKIKILHNGDWLTKLSLKELIAIASNISAIQLFKRDSFTRRIGEGDTVWYHETLYPLLQGYDSVAMDVDLEIGGTDQEFNMLVGRELQRKINNREKFVLTTPMIEGIDGKQMSKTSGNCIFLDESAHDMYFKIMRIRDEQLESYLTLLTDLEQEMISDLVDNPLEAKKALAFDIAKQFHGASKAALAQTEFEQTVQQKRVPSDMPTLHLTNQPLTILALARLAAPEQSSGQLKRLIEQGGVEYNGEKITILTTEIQPMQDAVLRVGKRHYYQLALS
jgi:tyrosyl-tRNA synthetase